MYTYDATGNKLKQTTVSAGNTTQRYYSGGFEYDNTKALNLIHMDEGVISKSGTTFTYEYFLKDHLGNTRVVFKPHNNAALWLQTADYYPFGMTSFSSESGTDNKYLFNGKELQDNQIGGVSLEWYDYGARFYDPQIGRWMSPDLLAEYRLNVSPYNYVRNNPIRFIDLFGLIDTIKLPEVQITADRNPPRQSGFIRFLYGIDRAIEGNTNPREVRDADWFDDWVIRHFDMRVVKEIGEAFGDNRAEGTNNNKVRSNESYQGKEDREIIKEKAGNNQEIIENNPLVKKYKEESEYDYRSEGKESDSIIETHTVYFDKEKGNIVRDWKVHKETHDGRPISKKYRQR